MASKDEVLQQYSSIGLRAYLPSGKQAWQVWSGDELSVLGADKTGSVRSTIDAVHSSFQKLVRITSSSGIRLTVSEATALALKDNSAISPRHALGLQIPVRDIDGFRWETVINVEPTDRGTVVTIVCGERCYAAGDEPGRYIYTRGALSRG